MNRYLIALFIVILFLFASASISVSAVDNVQPEPTYVPPMRICDVTYDDVKKLCNDRYFVVNYDASNVGRLFIDGKRVDWPENHDYKKTVGDCNIGLLAMRTCNNESDSYKYLIKAKGKHDIYIENKNDIEVYSGRSCKDVIKEWDDPDDKWVVYHSGSDKWDISKSPV